MRILVTNDDGIDSVGLHVLARRLEQIGGVVVAAPDREYSGYGAALGTLHLLQPEVHRERIDGVSEAWSVNGPPGLCAYFARLGAFGDIDILVSGINPGANTGRAIYHSGTVGAAITARNGGLPGVAISQSVTGFGVEGQGWDEMILNQEWDTAAEVAAVVVEAMLREPAEYAPVVNLNVPNCPLDQVKGWRHAEVALLPPRAVAEAKLVPKPGYDEAFHVEMTWGDHNELPVETDGGAVEQDLVAVSYLSRIAHEPRSDLAAVDSALDGLIAR